MWRKTWTLKLWVLANVPSWSVWWNWIVFTKQYSYDNIQMPINILPMTFAAYTLNKKNPVTLKYVMESDCYQEKQWKKSVHVLDLLGGIAMLPRFTKKTEIVFYLSLSRAFYCTVVFWYRKLWKSVKVISDQY